MKQALLSVVCLLSCAVTADSLTAESGRSVRFTRTALFPGYDGKWCKVQPSVASDGDKVALLTYQMLNLEGVDVFSGQYLSKSTDGGETWSPPVVIPGAADAYDSGLRVARYVSVYYLAGRKRWSAMGSATMYDGNSHPYQKYVGGKPYCYPIQADVDVGTGTISNYRPMPFPFKYELAMRFGQVVECEDGEVLMPFYFRPVGGGKKGRAVVVRYRFGKDGWEVVKAGTPVVEDSLARGVGEPSVVKFGGRYYMTLRSDEYGMYAESEDGLAYSKPIKWAWADGNPIGNANTQQHWVQIGDRMYLAYTRVTPTNGHVFRNRAPIFIAEFDPVKRCLKRETEQSVVPERGARLGNFAVAPNRAGESWLVTAEWMQPKGCEKSGSDNSLWLIKFKPRIDGLQGYARYVDVFTGTSATGHTHPAAAFPFGMIQAGPDKGERDWAHCSDYQYGDKAVLGYSQNHLSGTGSPDYGDVRVLPFSGKFRGIGMSSAIDKASERAEPGYYEVRQSEDGVHVELVAESWFKVFPGNRRSDGEPVANLLHYGDHDTGGYLWKKGGLRKRSEYAQMSDEEFDKFLDEQMLYRFNHRAEAWEKCFKEKFEPIRKVNVKGYDFVLAHFDPRGPKGAGNTPGLREFLAAQKFDPKKPFFFSQHRVPNGTALGSGRGHDDGESTKILSQYPNCVTFCGHMHYSYFCEKCFWKGAFTCIQTPALQNPWVASGSDPTDLSKGKVDRSVTQCYVLNVYDDKLAIERRNFGSGEKDAADWKA